MRLAARPAESKYWVLCFGNRRQDLPHKMKVPQTCAGCSGKKAGVCSGALSKENMSNVMAISLVGRSTVYNFLFVCMC